MKTLTFRAGGRELAIDVAQVLAVRSARYVSPVRGAPDGVIGIAAFRGEVVTVVAIPGVEGSASAEGFLLRLAPPRDHLALYVPGQVGLSEETHSPRERFDPTRLG